MEQTAVPGKGRDLEAQPRGARDSCRLPRGPGKKQETGSLAPLGGERQAAGSGEPVGGGREPCLSDDGGGGLGFQRLLHGPESFGRAPGAHEQEAMKGKAPCLGAPPIGQADLARGHFLDDPDEPGPRPGRDALHSEREGEARRLRHGGGAGGNDLAEAMARMIEQPLERIAAIVA